MKIKPQKIYAPLYHNKDKFIILVTGGRGSGKSFNVSTFIERLLFEVRHPSPEKRIVHQVLYTRYTMVSAHISVIPEFMEKVDLDGHSKYFRSTKTDVKNLRSGGCVMFRGIKTSSGVQTAKLKSIHGITTFVVDEAEEWVSEKEFETIMLSIRQKGIQNRIIIVMNPTDSNHWVYKRFIENTHKFVDIDGVQVQISTHPNVLHIHTTYFDNIENLSPEFLNEVKEMKENNPEKYAHTVIGRWADVAEGAVFKKWGIVEEFPMWCKKVGIGLDFGYSVDSTAAVRCGIIDNALYLDEIDYRTGLLSTDIIKSLRPWNLKVIADSADPRLIQEIHNGGINIYPVEKGQGSINAGIDKMQSMEIFVTKRSYNLMNELRNYVWDKDKDGRYINTPVDAFNHCFRGDTLITTIKGDIPIKDVHVGDYVLTRKGFRKVLQKHNNGIKKVVEKEFVTGLRKRTFFATLEHKFNVNGKWKKYGELTKGDNLFVLSSLMEKSIVDTQMGNTPTIITTNGKRMVDTTKNSCITRCMNFIKGKFQVVKSYIILTTILSIMTLAILLRLLQVNIKNYILKNYQSIKQESTRARFGLLNQIGMNAEERLMKTCLTNVGNVNNVVQNTFQQMFISDSVQKNVTIDGNTHRLNAMLKWFANIAEKHSWVTSTSNPNVVPMNVHINCKELSDVITKSESYCEVYDLTIDGEHEYFANGVLVHNCIDAARYYVLGELLGRILKPKDISGIFGH